jgi:hypothetical protein
MTPQNDRLDLSFNLSGHLILAKIGAYEGMGARRKLGENWPRNWDNFSDMLANRSWPIFSVVKSTSCRRDFGTNLAPIQILAKSTFIIMLSGMGRKSAKILAPFFWRQYLSNYWRFSEKRQNFLKLLVLFGKAPFLSKLVPLHIMQNFVLSTILFTSSLP